MRSTVMIALCMALSACATSGVKLDREIVPVVKYIVKIPPAELMTAPAPVEPVNVDTARQSDIAAWIIRNEARSQQLEDQLRGIATFFMTEQNKADVTAQQETAAAAAAANQRQLDHAASVTNPNKK